MSGTRESALKAAETKRNLYGKDFFSNIGKEGAKIRNKSDKRYLPFKDKDLASRAGKKGAEAKKNLTS